MLTDNISQTKVNNSTFIFITDKVFRFPVPWIQLFPLGTSQSTDTCNIYMFFNFYCTCIFIVRASLCEVLVNCDKKEGHFVKTLFQHFPQIPMITSSKTNTIYCIKQCIITELLQSFRDDMLRMNDNFTVLTITSVEVAHLKQWHCKENSSTSKPTKLKIRQLHDVPLRKLIFCAK